MFRICTFMLTACVAFLQAQPRVLVGTEQLDEIVAKTQGKRVGLLANHTAALGHAHLADLLKSLKVNLVKIYAPEHGFRGNVPDGEQIKDGVDPRTGLPVISLYGDNKKPTAKQLADVDIVLFDIQDVGTRFYTYISSLHYLMEACAENKKKVIILDRPNPNGSFIDGPVLKPEFKSFIGMHPIPIAHGMTVGELAQMINGEGWLAGGKKCELEVITVKYWKHEDPFKLPIAPSPNLPNNHAVNLYPYICLFEGTVMSLGRGTAMPFEVLGHPDLKDQPFEFTPVSIPDKSKYPPLENQKCFGIDLRNEEPERKISLKHLIYFYNLFPDKEKFFTPYFDKLAGNAELKEQIKQGLTEEQIRETWQKDLEAFKEKRKKYLLYP
ncbi:MAG: exo-beta-N-acetylmuramidase NamZ family protein [Bacteroidota bacterium]